MGERSELKIKKKCQGVNFFLAAPLDYLFDFFFKKQIL